MIFFVVTSPFVVLFGPFDNTKRAVVGAIMRSRHPQYITWLFNQNELNSILGVVNNTEQQKLFDFNIRKDSSLKIQKIESNRFVGYLLEIPDPSRIQVATAPDIQERGDTTSNIAKANDAVAAINGGGFYDPQGTGTGRLPYGFILHNGKYLLGENVGPNEKVDFIGFTDKGQLIAGKYSKKKLAELGAYLWTSAHYQRGKGDQAWRWRLGNQSPFRYRAEKRWYSAFPRCRWTTAWLQYRSHTGGYAEYYV